MRQVSNLFPSITDRGTFAIAVHRAAQMKRTRAEVRTFLGNLDSELNGLIAQLRACQFRFSPYRKFYIRDPKHRAR